MIDISEVLTDVAKWNNKKTEICEYLNPDFRVHYNKISDIIEDYLNDTGVSLRNAAQLSIVVSEVVGSVVEFVEEKDVSYYASIAVLYDCVNMG